MSLHDLLLDQAKFELPQILQKLYISRQISANLAENSLIKVIMGPRRAGKSFFAIHQINSQIKFAYVNFEEKRLVEGITPELLFNNLQEIYQDVSVFFMDEVQNLPDWEEYALLYQRRGIDVIVTGSNSKLLQNEFATKLTGRYVPTFVFPFSFTEYLLTKGNIQKMTSLEKMTHLTKYLQEGGFPATIIEPVDRYRYLRDLFDAILLKDIRDRYNIRKPGLLEDYAHYLMANNAKELSFRNAANRLQTSSDTIATYFGYMVDAFLFFAIPRYSEKMHEQIVYNKKVYAIDTGLANYNGFKILDNIDRLYENIVAIVLYYLMLLGEITVFYWKDNQDHEIEFVVKQGIEIVALIQVAKEIEQNVTKTREIRSIIKGSPYFNCDNLIVLSESYESVEELTWFGITKKIRFIPLWKWLIMDYKEKISLPM
jgi:predicted AAA+ superfamily ATPase